MPGAAGGLPWSLGAFVAPRELGRKRTQEKLLQGIEGVVPKCSRRTFTTVAPGCLACQLEKCVLVQRHFSLSGAEGSRDGSALGRMSAFTAAALFIPSSGACRVVKVPKNPWKKYKSRQIKDETELHSVSKRPF